MGKKQLLTYRARQRKCVQCRKQRVGGYYNIEPIKKDMWICDKCIKGVDVSNAKVTALIK